MPNLTGTDMFLIGLLALPLYLCACNSVSSRVEAPIVETGFGSTVAQRSAPISAVPPTAVEVQQALQRVFADDVEVGNEPTTNFFAGDFNGDNSTDLAVIVKPNPAKLTDLNGQFANWSVEDPHHAFTPPRTRAVVHLPPAAARELVVSRDVLLAVIHGVGSSGWRDASARQAFLLEHAVGWKMRVDTPSAALKQDFGAMPPSANVIAENVGGVKGVLYWNGAGYAWHREP
jgi:hypothetical protein